MLILSRKTTERIQIGEDILITVLKFRGKVVQLGIEAPRETKVLRAELPVKPMIFEAVGH
jgi:carbon storage regulator